MKYEAHHLGPHSDGHLWTGWAAAAKSSSGPAARRLPPGETKALLRHVSFQQPRLGIVTLAAPAQHALHLVAQGRRQLLTCRDDYPLLRFALVAPMEQGPLEICNTAPGSQEVLIHAFHLLPLPGMRSAAWLPPARRLLHKITGAPAQWSPADFPCSHFDGLKYLQWNPDVQQAMLDRKCRSALQHYLKFGRREARAFPFAVDRPPNPGSLLNLAHRLRTQEQEQKNGRQALEAKQVAADERNKLLSEENELLLLQLHQVQEELEQYFLENRKLQESQQKLTTLESEHSELATRHSSVATAFKELESKHSSLVAERDQALRERELIDTSLKALAAESSNLRVKAVDAAAKNESLAQEIKEVRDDLAKSTTENKSLLQELQKVQGELVKKVSENSELQDRQKSALTVRQDLESRIQTLATERDNATKERDALKKTATERAMRIAELEAQVADQAERQKQIDEEMAKAEGQLDMLKDLLRPALT
jgi:hypothetical protein